MSKEDLIKWVRRIPHSEYRNFSDEELRSALSREDLIKIMRSLIVDTLALSSVDEESLEHAESSAISIL